MPLIFLCRNGECEVLLHVLRSALASDYRSVSTPLHPVLVRMQRSPASISSQPANSKDYNLFIFTYLQNYYLRPTTW